MSRILITTTQKEEVKRRQLLVSIARKREMLQKWTTKVEELRMELDLIQHEYNVRIGYLLLKDNQLDLEIIHLKNIEHLMSEGMTYEQAVKAEEDKFYADILQKQKQQEEEIEIEKEMLEKREKVSDTTKEEMKIIWKRLIRKFHPDLAIEPEEKHKREEIMKKINKAYAEGDIETLKSFEKNYIDDDFQVATLPVLEKYLVDIENMLLFWKSAYMTLQVGEWYAWKKKIDKAKKENGDVFAELEKKLLDDIVRKIEIAQKLRNSVGK